MIWMAVGTTLHVFHVKLAARSVPGVWYGNWKVHFERIAARLGPGAL